jgi:hypothetical protein
MSEKKVPIHLIFTSIYVVLALITLIPNASASKECLLGYNALCTFSPISSALFLGLAGLHIYLNSKSKAKEASQ